MIHVGTNIYYWEAAQPHGKLRPALLRWALEIRRQSMADLFWYCYFDARGPHVFALFGTTPEKQASLCAFLASEIRSFLRDCPSPAQNPADIEQRHRECRGKTLCRPDRCEGLAENNSFVMFTHEPGDYPFHLGKDSASRDELWSRLDALSIWTLVQEDVSLKQLAVSWLAGIDEALERLGAPSESYWRLHAASLIPPLADRGNLPELAATLQRAVGERNLKTFEKLWNPPVEADSALDMHGLVKLVMDESSAPLEARFRTLREISHIVLGQLAQTVNLQIPMVLYAWQRSLSR
jgi:hypothetical protein